MSLKGPSNLESQVGGMVHGIRGGDVRHPKATKFVSKFETLKPSFSKSQLEEGRALPRPERKKYFAKLKEEYYKAS